MWTGRSSPRFGDKSSFLRRARSPVQPCTPGVDEVFEEEIKIIGQKPRPVRLPAPIPVHQAKVRLPPVPTRKGCDTADIAKMYRVCKTPAPHHSSRTHTVRIDEHLQLFS